VGRDTISASTGRIKLTIYLAIQFVFLIKSAVILDVERTRATRLDPLAKSKQRREKQHNKEKSLKDVTKLCHNLGLKRFMGAFESRVFLKPRGLSIETSG